MAINTSALTAYVEERRLPLIKKAVLGGKTIPMLNLQTGVKKSAALNLLTSAVAFGNGAACGWNEAGESTLSQRVIEAGNIKINMSFCDKQLLKYWAGYDVKVAAGYKTLPFEEEFVNSVIDDINAKLEKAVWQGDTTSADVNLNKFDGLIKIIDAEASVISATTGTTVYDTVMNVYKAIPVEILDKATIVMGADKVRELVAEMQATSLLSFAQVEDKGNVVYIPNTGVKVVGVQGLVGTDRVFAADFENNVFYGTDLEGDEEKFELWYSQDNREFRLAVEFNAGVQVAYPNQVVKATL